MAAEQARQFIEQAVQSLQGGQVYQALELADQAIAQDPRSAEAYILSGVALSQSNQPQAANEAFESAIDLEPGNAKAFYNYSVHLYALGKKPEALQMANHAMVIDPSHSAARDMVARIEVESGIRVEDQPPLKFPEPKPLEYREGYDDFCGHGIPFVEKMGGAWTGIGYAIGGISFLDFIFVIIRIVTLALRSTLTTAEFVKALNDGLGNPIALFVFLAGLIWVILDVLDERGNYVWILAQALCGGLSLSFVSMPLYLLTGRKNV